MHPHRGINWDGMGIFTSLLCAIHCALLPLAVSFLPLIGCEFIRNPLFEFGMIGLEFVIGTAALWHGFTRHHHRLTPWLRFSRFRKTSCGGFVTFAALNAHSGHILKRHLL